MWCLYDGYPHPRCMTQHFSSLNWSTPFSFHFCGLVMLSCREPTVKGFRQWYTKQEKDNLVYIACEIGQITVTNGLKGCSSHCITAWHYIIMNYRTISVTVIPAVLCNFQYLLNSIVEFSSSLSKQINESTLTGIFRPQ